MFQLQNITVQSGKIQVKQKEEPTTIISTGQRTYYSLSIDVLFFIFPMTSMKKLVMCLCLINDSFLKTKVLDFFFQTK